MGSSSGHTLTLTYSGGSIDVFCSPKYRYRIDSVVPPAAAESEGKGQHGEQDHGEDAEPARDEVADRAGQPGPPTAAGHRLAAAASRRPRVPARRRGTIHMRLTKQAEPVGPARAFQYWAPSGASGLRRAPSVRFSCRSASSSARPALAGGPDHRGAELLVLPIARGERRG
jgi:hypothetical protein